MDHASALTCLPPPGVSTRVVAHVPVAPRYSQILSIQDLDRTVGEFHG